MYESHFGLSGPPFQLSPDPDPYFASAQHQAALDGLRASALQAPGIVVLTGEIGAGKTTVLCRWRAERLALPAADQPLVAWLASARLGVHELPRAVAIAFGVPVKAMTPVIGHEATGEQDAAATLCEQLWTRMLPGQVPSASLVIDEAQHLGTAALLWLQRLVDQATHAGLALRICLAGQPELQARLAEAALAGWRGQLLPHLQPLNAQQTRQYVLHRLTRVGWRGQPGFEREAFDEIHARTGGLPRRIHLLCNRLLLAQFLRATSHVSAADVREVGRELQQELGTGGAAAWPLPLACPAQEAAAPADVPPACKGQVTPRGPLLLLASGRSGHIKSQPLLQAIEARQDLPAPMLASAADGGDALHAPARAGTGKRSVACRMTLLGDPATEGEAQVVRRFATLLACECPCAVVLFDDDPLTRACGGVAQAHGVPRVWVGPQASEPAGDPAGPQAALHIASLPMAGPSPAVCAGSLLIDAVMAALKVELKSRGPRLGAAAAALGPQGYGVVALKELAPKEESALPFLPRALAVVHATSRALPLVWPMRAAALAAMRAAPAEPLGWDARIDMVDALPHSGFIRLLQDATCVLTDCTEVIEEAALLGVPCLSLGVQHAAGLPAEDVGLSAAHAMRAAFALVARGGGAALPTRPPLWDGHAADRAAEALARWLAARDGLPAVQAPPAPTAEPAGRLAAGWFPLIESDRHRKESHGPVLHL